MFGDEYYNRMLNDLFGIRVRPLSAAGRLLASLDEAERAVVSLDHISDELRAQLRRCEVRSKWPTWEHKHAN